MLLDIKSITKWKKGKKASRMYVNLFAAHLQTFLMRFAPGEETALWEAKIEARSKR